MKVYLDHAATTPVDPEVLRAMLPYFKEKFGNPSSIHSWGQEARKAVDKAREQVAKALGASPQEIIFTSGSTEAINLAHKGLIEVAKFQSGKVSKLKLPHIITSVVEHKGVLEACKHLEKSGMAKATYLPVDKYGAVSLKDIKKAIRPETVLVSVMYVNNEVGTIQPISEIGAEVQRYKGTGRKIYFHTDATQAIQYLDCDVNQLGVDLLSLSAHKFYGPKGVGALYVRKGTPLIRQQNGGSQEYHLRSGTENVPYIVGLGKAMELNAKRKTRQKLTHLDGQAQNVKRIEKLRDRLIRGVLEISDVKVTGDLKQRAPHIASFVVKGVEGEAMLLMLSEKGIAASSGSACTSGLLKPSHVLTAMGIPPELAHGSLRFSLGKGTTKEEIDYVIKVLPGMVKKLRRMAPRLGTRY